MNGARTCREEGIEPLDVELRRGPKSASPALLTRMSTSPASFARRRTSAGLPRSAARSAPGRPRDDLLHRRGAALGVAAVDDDLGTVAGELQGDRATDAGGRARDQRLLILEVARLKD